MTANERRLAKLLREADALMFDYIDAEDAKIIAARAAELLNEKVSREAPAK